MDFCVRGTGVGVVEGGNQSEKKKGEAILLSGQDGTKKGERMENLGGRKEEDA